MYHGFIAPRLFSHGRSASAGVTRASSPLGGHTKSRSTTALGEMPEPEVSPLAVNGSQCYEGAEQTGLGLRASTQDNTSAEVSALNEQLIRAMNQQTSLDDTLAQSRHELEAARKEIARLESENNGHNERLSTGTVITKDDADRVNDGILVKLKEERRQRTLAEQDRSKMEAELENLTASLFEEANKMVASANRDRDAVERKNKQLREQIKDGELLLVSQSEQLAELKVLMHSIQPESSLEHTVSPRISEGPLSPAITHEHQTVIRLLEAMNLSPSTPLSQDVSPAPATSFTQLLKPHCRSDIPAYDDFRSLVQLSTRSNHPSRAGSGSYGGLGVIGISSLSTVTASPASTNNSSTSLNITNTTSKSSSQSPAIPGSFNATPVSMSADPLNSVRGPIPLKDTKFYKRLLVEDVEPTLRLDLSQTISWLNRRSILNALADSTLIVEPIPEASRKLYGRYTPCALCGESRRENENPRTHRMRVNEGENATKWSLCVVCLEKVRGVGDLIGYVRMVRDGVVKCQDPVEEAEAWDELIRLRERLFWARMAGGVIPSFLPKSESFKGSPNVKLLAEPKLRGAISESHTPDEEEDASTSESASSNDLAPSKSQEDIARQLQSELEGPLTTFDSIKDKTLEAVQSPNATPPSTPPRKRESASGFPKINIPKMGMPDRLWKGEVNVLR